MKPLVVFIVGPTAVGKTAVSLELAKQIDAEIISCDSMQIYKGMDILSSKPSLEQRKKTAHHLIDVAAPQDEFNVSQFRKMSLEAVSDILSRKKVPLFVGGTGLYMSVVVDGIFEAKAEDAAVRQRLFEQDQEHGSGFLHRQLTKVDPQAAAKIHANDTKRLVRALEVFAVTGIPISELQKKRQGLERDHLVMIFGLRLPLERLYERINKRVDEMFEDGLVDEVKRLIGQPLSRTAFAAIGIPEVAGYLKGEYSLDEAMSLMKQHTRQFARRQMTWFRKDERVRWIDVEDMEVQQVCDEINAQMSDTRGSL